MNTLLGDASTPPTSRHQRSSSPTKLTNQQPSTCPRNIKSHVSSRLPKVSFLLAIVAPISVQIIVQRIELLATRQTIIIAIIVDSLRHITKRSTTLKNNLIVIVVANHELCIRSAGQRCTNTRSGREVAQVRVDGAYALDAVRDIIVVGRTPRLSGNGPAE